MNFSWLLGSKLGRLLVGKLVSYILPFWVVPIYTFLVLGSPRGSNVLECSNPMLTHPTEPSGTAFLAESS